MSVLSRACRARENPINLRLSRLSPAFPRLSGPARKALEKGPLILSVASYWEVVIKARKGLFEIADPVSWWARAIGFLGGDILSIRAAHISTLAVLPDVHKDTFDRILIAQAVAEGFALVSSDEAIGKYAVKVVW